MFMHGVAFACAVFTLLIIINGEQRMGELIKRDSKATRVTLTVISVVIIVYCVVQALLRLDF